MKKILLAIVASLLLLSGCTPKEKELTQYTKRTLTAGFDTELVLIGYAYSEAEFDEYYELMRERYLYYNALFDHFKDYEGVNNIKTINDNAGIQPVVVDPVIIELLQFIFEYDDYNDQKFDMTLGAVLEIWHQYRDVGMMKNQEGEPGVVPELSLLQEAKELTGSDLLVIDEENLTVFLTKEGASLDLGAVAKGWVTEQVALDLEEAGLTHGALNAG
ncbi:MAG: FAD:protein FMN transferase, partial [Erysipelothrix sp.]|nr:FAD:protein FMN transferase [Erysipelothrix sp.]